MYYYIRLSSSCFVWIPIDHLTFYGGFEEGGGEEEDEDDMEIEGACLDASTNERTGLFGKSEKKYGLIHSELGRRRFDDLFARLVY